MTTADALAAITVANFDLTRFVQVTPETSVVDTVSAMQSAERACACIVDGEELVGIFTQRDILHRVIGRSGDWSRPISGEMTAGPRTVTSDASLSEALEVMVKWWVRDLPVVDDDGFKGNIGFFTAVEFMGAQLRQRLEGPLADDVVREGLAFVDFTGINLRPPVTISAHDPVAVAIHHLRNRGLEQVTITNDRGHLVGVITEFALQQRIGCDSIDLDAVTAEEMMIAEPNTISVRSTIAEGIRTLENDGRSNVALVGETGQPSGVASVRQIAEFIDAALDAAEAA